MARHVCVPAGTNEPLAMSSYGPGQYDGRCPRARDYRDCSQRGLCRPERFPNQIEERHSIETVPGFCLGRRGQLSRAPTNNQRE